MDSWNESQFLARILEAPQSCGKVQDCLIHAQLVTHDMFCKGPWLPYQVLVTTSLFHSQHSLMKLWPNPVTLAPNFLCTAILVPALRTIFPKIQSSSLTDLLSEQLAFSQFPVFIHCRRLSNSSSTPEVASVSPPVMAFSTAVFATNCCPPFSATFLVLVSSIIVRRDKASAMFICPGKYFREENEAVAGEPSFDSCWRSGPLRINEFERFVIGPQSKY